MRAPRQIAISIFLGVVLAVTALVCGAKAENGAEKTEPRELTIKGDNSLSGPAQLAWIDYMTEAANGVYIGIQKMLAVSREEKDTLKVTCLEDRQTQVRVSLEGVEERRNALKVAVDKGDTKSANQNFSILKIYISKILELKGQADNCLGESDIVFGSTETIMWIEGVLPPEDFSVVEIPPIDVDPPEHTSGYF